MEETPETVTLSSQEAIGLVLNIWDAIEAFETGGQPRETWADEMRVWAVMLIDRMEGGT